MASDLIKHLHNFNSKERFLLIGHVLGNPDFALGSHFGEELATAFHLDLPDDLFCAMDYHLDWIYASLQLHVDDGTKQIYPNHDKVIKAQQEDVDLLIGFKQGKATHIIMVEVKGVTGWTNSQMKSKAASLRDIFGDDGKNGNM